MSSLALADAPRTGPGVPEFAVRPGYTVTLAAQDLGETRFIVFDDSGRLYLSQPNTGSIVQLIDADNDGTFESKRDFATGFEMVHAMQWKDGWLWWARSGQVGKSRDTNDDGAADETVIVLDNLPKGGGHWWRSLLVTNDAIYTSIGDSGNINDETDTDRQKIWKYTIDGTSRTLFASGIRNTEKLMLRPGTDEVWGCDHGSDWYGRPWGDRGGKQPITDLNPPDEFNHYVEGGFYGHPFVVGNKLPRIEFADRKDIVELADKTIPPAWSNGAHWANNGWTFLTKDAFPDHQGDAIIAFHGSWNSKTRVGYKVQRILFDKVTGKPYGSLTIVDCVKDNRVLARPCDVTEAPDGTLLFTDSLGGRLFRVARATSP